MNKVIYLESDEEIISVIDRLKEAKEKHVALVIPAGAIMLGSAVNLKLLMEESGKIDKKVSIVTSDATGRNIASQIGFTVYENLGDARAIREKDLEEQEKLPVFSRKAEKRLEEIEGEEGEKTYTDLEENNNEAEDVFENNAEEKEAIFAPRKVYKESDFGVTRDYRGGSRSKVGQEIIKNKKFWLFGAIGFVVVLFLLVFIFPKATVYLNVISSEEKLDIGFKLSTDVSAVGSADSKITLPAKWEAKEQEVSLDIPATGQKNVGDKASGAVIVYNRSGKTVTIVPNSEFLTSDGKKFVNSGIISVPGAFVSDYGELIPGKASSEITAEDGGTASNISPSKFSIPALSDTLGNLVYGQSSDAFAGGTDKNAKVVSHDDIDNAKQRAQDEMEKKLEGEFGMQGEEIFVKGLDTSENISEDISKKENDEADSFTVQERTRFSFLVFNKNDFDKMFEDSLKLNLSNQKQLVGSGYRSVEWTVISFDDKKKEAELNAKATILTATSINQDFIKSKIVTLNVQELRVFLSQYPEVELDHVSFFPPLLISSIPSNEKNVNVVVKYIEK